MNALTAFFLSAAVAVSAFGLLSGWLPLWLAAAMWFGGAVFTVITLSVWAELDAMEDSDA